MRFKLQVDEMGLGGASQKKQQKETNKINKVHVLISETWAYVALM